MNPLKKSLGIKSVLSILILSAVVSYVNSGYESRSLITLKPLDSQVAAGAGLMTALQQSNTAWETTFQLKHYLQSTDSLSSIEQNIDTQTALVPKTFELVGYEAADLWPDLLKVKYIAESNSLEVSLTAQEPQAAEVLLGSLTESANHWVNQMNQTLAQASIANYADELEKLSGRLSLAQEELKNLQDITGSLDSEQDAQASVELRAEIEARLIEEQSKLSQLSGYLAAASPEYKNQVQVIRQLQAKIKSPSSTTPQNLAQSALLLRQAKANVVFLEKELELVRVKQEEARARAHSQSFALVEISRPSLADSSNWILRFMETSAFAFLLLAMCVIGLKTWNKS